MNKFVAIIDYGLGNLRSVSKAIEKTGAKVEVTNNPEKIAKSKAVILPGVGSFYKGIENLESLGILSSIFDAIKESKPFLGICLGMQLLFSESEEHGISKGLNIIKGKVKKFEGNIKVPHMGWNTVKFKVQNEKFKMKILKNIPDESYFYFVHSYYVEPEKDDIVIATTEYGRDFVSAINKDNIWGVQFHPEKSGQLGLNLLRNFVGLAE